MRKHRFPGRVQGRFFLLGGDGSTVGDEVFHGHDDGEGLDLAGNAASGHFGAEVGDFPEAVQYLFAVQVQAALFRRRSCWTSCCCTAARCSSM